jgi:hypothetical protein
MIPKLAGRLRAEDRRSPLDLVEIKLEYPVLGEEPFEKRDQSKLDSFFEDRTLRPEEHILGELLGDGGPAAAEAFLGEVSVHDLLELEPVESVVDVETAVLCGDHRVLQVGGDTRKGDVELAFVVMLLFEKRLHFTLHLNCGRGRIERPQRKDQARADKIEYKDKPQDDEQEGSQPTPFAFGRTLGALKAPAGD